MEQQPGSPPARALGVTAAAGDVLVLLLRRWHDVAAETLPGDHALTDLLTSRLRELAVRPVPPAEAELLDITEAAAQHAVARAGAEPARQLSKRLRRSIYEYLLSLDAMSAAEVSAPGLDPSTAADALFGAAALRRDGAPELVWDEPSLRVLEGGAAEPVAGAPEHAEPHDDEPHDEEPRDEEAHEEEPRDEEPHDSDAVVETAGAEPRDEEPVAEPPPVIEAPELEDDGDVDGRLDPADAEVEAVAVDAATDGASAVETPGDELGDPEDAPVGAASPSPFEERSAGVHVAGERPHLVVVELAGDAPAPTVADGDGPIHSLTHPADGGDVRRVPELFSRGDADEERDGGPQAGGTASESAPLVVPSYRAWADVLASGEDEEPVAAAPPHVVAPSEVRPIRGLQARLAARARAERERAAETVHAPEPVDHAGAGEHEGTAVESDADREPAEEPASARRHHDAEESASPGESDEAGAAEADEVEPRAEVEHPAEVEQPLEVEQRAEVEERAQVEQPADPGHAAEVVEGGVDGTDVDAGAEPAPAAAAPADDDTPWRLPAAPAAVVPFRWNPPPADHGRAAPGDAPWLPAASAQPDHVRSPWLGAAAAATPAPAEEWDAEPTILPWTPGAPESEDAGAIADQELDVEVGHWPAGSPSRGWDALPEWPAARGISLVDDAGVSRNGHTPAEDAADGDAPDAALESDEVGDPDELGEGSTDLRWSVRRSPRQQALQQRMAQRRRDEVIRAAAAAFDESATTAPRRHRLPELVPQRVPEQVDGLLRRKRAGEAAALVQRAAQEIGGREVADLALECGDRCRDRHQTRAAINSYLAAWRADPVYEAPLWRLAETCLADHETELAVGYLERIADLMRARGDDEGAIEVYRKVVTVAPDRADVRALLQTAQTIGRFPD